MSMPPKSPFNLAADPDKQQTADKSNTDMRLEPKHKPQQPRLAPRGMMGVQKGLPRPQQQEERQKRFTLGKGGELRRVFKPIAARDRDSGRER
ncbi:MAG: hypothetical protein EP341_11705 [Sphingomonadales bacterium]|nr:MAG: hypothetical protein EP341_11705 [Sphingomonadales bacterium]